VKQGVDCWPLGRGSMTSPAKPDSHNTKYDFGQKYQAAPGLAQLEVIQTAPTAMSYN
jgi:hypothetical protein